MAVNDRKIVFALAAGIVLVGALSFLSIQNLKGETSANIKTLESNIAQLIKELSIKTDDIKRNLSFENQLLDSKIEAVSLDTKKKMTTLTDVIGDLQEESSKQLEALKNEVAGITVQSSDFSSVIEDVLPGVVSVQTDVGLGSGAIIRKDGYIVTNYHVIKGANAARIQKYNKDIFAVRIAGINENADVAVLKIDGAHHELLFGDSGQAKTGEKVIALGNPGGLDFTVTEGIVSATHRELNGISYIQTDVPINPGNSGGPLVNKQGRIIGINNFKIKGFEGIGFAIESSLVESIADGIIKKDEQASAP